MDVFTSISLNYLPKARVLASTLKRRHPDWVFHLIISDRCAPGFDVDVTQEPFDTCIWIDRMEITDISKWIFKHTLVEVCTGVKGPVALSLLNEGAEKVMYLDPDIAVFNRLDDIDRLLDDHPVILTPHLLEHEDVDSDIVANEVCTLQHGVFNLGFFAVNNSSEGQRFVRWFSQRLLQFCYDDIPNGLFTDQKWCDLAPIFFNEVHINRDPGCNVASWNLSRRTVTLSHDGTLLANDSPLKFYHFTGYDSGAGRLMTLKYSISNHLITEIWTWYRLQLEKHGQRHFENMNWYFDFFDNGEKIPLAARLLYRERPDLQKAFPDPFATANDGGYFAWYRTNALA